MKFRSMLLETPWVDMEGVEYETEPLIWDFCTEETPTDGGWIEQLYTLYSKGFMDSINKTKNEFQHVEFEPDEVEQITRNLLADTWFVNVFIRDFYKMSASNQEDVYSVLPEEMKELLK